MADEHYNTDRREASPVVRLEKVFSSLKHTVKEQAAEMQKLKEWKIEHETNAMRDKEDLDKVRISIDGKDGKGGIYGEAGLDDKVKEMITTVKSLWKYILGTGALVGLLSNLDRLFKSVGP